MTERAYDDRFDDPDEPNITDKLDVLAKLVRDQIALEDTIAETEQSLKEFRRQLGELSELKIPELLAETGLSEVKLETGEKVDIKEIVRVSTTGQYRAKINAWLRAQDKADLIKNEVTVEFDRGEEERAVEFVTLAQEWSKRVSQKEFVHSQTFAALIRESLEQGVELPMDELGIMVQKQTKITRS